MILSDISTIKKALVPLGVAGALAVLGWVGITGDMTVKEAVTLGITALIVWATKNGSKNGTN